MPVSSLSPLLLPSLLSLLPFSLLPSLFKLPQSSFLGHQFSLASMSSNVLLVISLIQVRNHKIWRLISLNFHRSPNLHRDKVWFGGIASGFSVGERSVRIIINRTRRNHMKGNIVHGAYWIASSLLRNQGRPLMQIRCLHNAICLEGDKGVMGLRCPIVGWQKLFCLLA